jgi:hypothetical protein
LGSLYQNFVSVKIGKVKRLREDLHAIFEKVIGYILIEVKILLKKVVQNKATFFL